MQQREFHLSISDPSASFPTSGSLLAMPETSADGKDPYELAPLNLCDKCIRLVEVCAFTTTKKIRCRLRSYTLETDCPLYIALSYKWGPNERYDDVELNDSLFPVGRNLWMFLQSRCLNGQSRLFWIDAICIDQSNNGERNHQVQMMSQIYSGAESVLIWLGVEEGSPELHAAMSAMQRMAEQPRAVGRKYISQQEHSSALSAFGEVAYWRRMWIIQEVVLAKRIMICSGSLEIDWSVFQGLVDHARFVLDKGRAEHPSDLQAFLSSAAVIVARVRTACANGRLPLRALVADLHDHEATDLRDKVYALHGLSIEGPSIAIDYGGTLTELFEQTLNAVCASWPPSSIKSLKRFAATLRDMLEVSCLEDQVTRGIEASQQLRSGDIRQWKAYRDYPMFPRTAAQNQPHILKPYLYNPSAAGSLCDFTNTLLHTITKKYPNTIEQFYDASLRRFKLMAFHPMLRSTLVIWREDLTVLVRSVSGMCERSVDLRSLVRLPQDWLTQRNNTLA